MNELEKFKFFSKDYIDERNYWECLIFLRKFFLSIIIDMRSLIPNELQSVLVIIILFCYLFFTMKTNPFRYTRANTMEKFSLSIGIICAFSTMIFSYCFVNRLKVFSNFILSIMKIVFLSCFLLKGNKLFALPSKENFSFVVSSGGLSSLIKKTVGTRRDSIWYLSLMSEVERISLGSLFWLQNDS